MIDLLVLKTLEYSEEEGWAILRLDVGVTLEPFVFQSSDKASIQILHKSLQSGYMSDLSKRDAYHNDVTWCERILVILGLSRRQTIKEMHMEVILKYLNAPTTKAHKKREKISFLIN